MAWYPAWHINWQRFRYWREQIGFESAYFKIKKESPRQITQRKENIMATQYFDNPTQGRKDFDESIPSQE